MLASFFRRAGLALLLIFITAIAVLSGWFGAIGAWSDASTLRPRWLVNQWRDGQGPVYSLPVWQQTRDELQAASVITPDNAQLFDDLGFLNAWRAYGLGTPPPGDPDHVLQRSLWSDAVVNYRQATVLRPTFPYTWTYLALAKHLIGEHDTEFWQAFDKALHYGHTETGVYQALGQIAFANWNALGAERQRSVTAMVSHAPVLSRESFLQLAEGAGVTLAGVPPVIWVDP